VDVIFVALYIEREKERDREREKGTRDILSYSFIRSPSLVWLKVD
jgi:hypothetical protein